LLIVAVAETELEDDDLELLEENLGLDASESVRHLWRAGRPFYFLL
jgi:hypothetical protein